jgi:hypothetical protein
MSSKLPVLFLVAVVVASFVGVNLPASNALINRDYTYVNDNQLTALYGNTKVCGDHMCAPGEWNQLQAKLTSAQLGNQGGRNTTQTTTPPITTTPSTVPSTPTTNATSAQMPTGVTPKLCSAVKDILSSTGVSSSVIGQVMADLGCS